MDKQKFQEGKELDLLNGKNGFTVTTRLFGRVKKWRVTRFPLGLMDMQSRLYHQLTIDSGYYDNSAPVTEVLGKAVKANARICAEIIAISVLGRRWKIFLFKWWLTRHFLWQIDSEHLLKFTRNLFEANNYKDFMASITLMSVNTVTRPAEATPKAVEIED